MAGILKALGFENKPEYLEKIPETLTPSDFTVHNTFHHGFPSQPICLAYDALQQLLAIGTETGAILLLGKPALERYFSHPKQVAILQMLFITNKGLLVTRCDNKTLYLWSLEEKEPTVVHSLEFNKENPTSVSHTYGSPWLYVGTEKGNVHAVHVETFMVSGYTIYWNECTDQTTQRRTPGEIIYVQEHPIDQGKVLVAFSSNLCVLWNLKNKGMEKRYFYNPADHHIMTSVCWLGNGKSFATSYSDGSIIIWNAKVDNRPEKIFFPHGNDSHAFQPIYKLQVLYTDSEPWYICSGGFPEDHLTSPQTLTIQHGRSSTLLSASSTIMDFICLPSSPFVTEVQKPFALVVLAKNELIVHDLQTLGFPAFSLPYGLDLHTPSVTCIEYYGNCPEEFVASLHSVKSKMMCDTKSTKPWPMKGGKWGEESPHQMTDLILTGHTDGSVRLWYCSSVIFQPFFTISTSRYFKMLYATLSPPHKPKPTKRQAPKRPPPPVPKTAQPQGKSPQTQRQQTIDVARSGTDDDSSEVTTSVPKSISSPAIMTMRVKTPDEEEFEVLQLPEGNGSGRGNGNGDRRSVSPNGEQDTPYPATGQVGPEVTASTEGIDGTQSTDLGQSTASINSDRKTVFSREKRSFFKKKSKDERERSDMLLSASTKEDKAKPKSHSSFRKQATKIIFGRKKGHSKRHATLEEVDAATAPTEEREEDQLERTLDAAEGRGETEYPSDLQMPASEGLQTPSSPGIVFTPTPTQTPTPARTPTPQTPTSAPALTPTRTMTPTQAPTPAESPTNEPPPRSKTPSELHPPASPQAPRDVASASATSPRNADEERSAQEPPTGVTATTQDDARKSPTGAGSTSSAEARKSPTGSGSMSSAEARKLPTGAGSTSPGEARKSPTVSTTATSSEKSVPQSEVVTLNEEDFFAIREINLCVWGQWLCVATTGGGVLAFAFHMEKRYRTPQSLNIDFSTDSVLNHSDATNNGATGPSPKAASAPGWVFQERVQDSHPGFYLLQHCQCLCSAGKQSPVVVSTMQFGLDFGLLAIGTNLGLAVVDTLKNTCLYTLSNLTTILYLAEPSKFSKQVMRESNMAAEARKPPILRRQTTRSLPNSPVSPLKSLSMSQLTNLKTPATPGEKEVGVAQADQPDFLCVEEHDHSVTSLQLVQLHLDKHLPPTLTLWVGTVSGKVAAYGVNIVPEKEGEAKNHRKIELIPTNLILDHKSPIVSLHFLNEWGDRQVVPYKPPRTIGQGVRTAEGREVQRNTATANATSNRRVRNYAIVVEEQRLRSLSFPGMLTISKCAVPLENDNVILTSEYFYCNDLPCLLSVTSCLQMHVHSLPGLKPLMSAPYPALIDPRAMCTFTVTGDGQLLYMTSPSEVQRACITKKDRLNLPACLPDSHVPTEDPQPASKGIISNLFSSGPVEINREATFGESAGRPYTSLAKRDGRSGCAYIKRQVDREMERGPRGIGGSSAGGLGGQFNKNREALDKRGKELSQLEQQTELMSSDAGEFAALTEQLRKKYGK